MTNRSTFVSFLSSALTALVALGSGCGTEGTVRLKYGGAEVDIPDAQHVRLREDANGAEIELGGRPRGPLRTQRDGGSGEARIAALDGWTAERERALSTTERRLAESTSKLRDSREELAGVRARASELDAKAERITERIKNAERDLAEVRAALEREEGRLAGATAERVAATAATVEERKLVEDLRAQAKSEAESLESRRLEERARLATLQRLVEERREELAESERSSGETMLEHATRVSPDEAPVVDETSSASGALAWLGAGASGLCVLVTMAIFVLRRRHRGRVRLVLAPRCANASVASDIRFVVDADGAHLEGADAEAGLERLQFTIGRHGDVLLRGDPLGELDVRVNDEGLPSTGTRAVEVGDVISIDGGDGIHSFVVEEVDAVNDAGNDAIVAKSAEAGDED